MTKEEFEQFLTENGKDIYSFCYYLAGKKDDADELYQDTMLHALKNCHRIHKTGNPKSFFIGISVNIYRNNRKKTLRRQQIAPTKNACNDQELWHKENNDALPEQEYLKKELYELIRKEIALLPEKYKLPVYMYYTGEMTVEEIAGALHLPKGTIKSRMHKARMIIKKRLEDWGYEN